MPPAPKAPLVVKTEQGAVEGSLLGTTRAFLGIPFAEPPIGARRWKAPIAHAPWTETRKAMAKGAACAQSSPITNQFDETSSEDCLTLNVWTPANPKTPSPPVLVWIHGGAFVLGSGSEDSYDGQVLSEATGAVIVTINYRLGPLGFLALPALKSEDGAHPSTGNYGLEDQQLALAWVKSNIAAFGGDAQRVTLFGESAGGISTCMHLVSPRSKGLFQRAIIESGPCNLGTAEATATKQGEAFLKALNCELVRDQLGCVRAKSTAEIIAALPLSSDFLFGKGASWRPVVDGWNLPEDPDKLLASGKFEKVPTVLGSNADEATLFFSLAGTMVADDAAFEALAEALVPSKGKEIVARYPRATYGSPQKAASTAVGDAAFVCPTRRAARAIAAAGGDVYLYHFTYAPQGTLFGDLGAFHSAEIKYVFGVPGQLQPKPLTDEEQALSASIMGYFSRHAEVGNPNGQGALAWPKYRADTDENIVLQKSITTQSRLKQDLCDFWDTITIIRP